MLGGVGWCTGTTRHTHMFYGDLRLSIQEKYADTAQPLPIYFSSIFWFDVALKQVQHHFKNVETKSNKVRGGLDRVYVNGQFQFHIPSVECVCVYQHQHPPQSCNTATLPLTS